MASLWEFENVTRSFTYKPSIQGLTIANAQPCQLATLSCRLEDPGAIYVFDNHDELVVRFNSVVIFAGLISRPLKLGSGHRPRVYELTAQDYTVLLRRDVITEDRNVTESIEDRVLWIMGFSDQGITTSGVAAITDEVGPLKSKGMTVAEALDQTAGEIAGSLYVDFTRDLQFFASPPGGSAPFGIRSTASPSWVSTDPAISGFRLSPESDAQALRVYVKGTGIAIWREDSAAITQWNIDHPDLGPPETAINDPSITTVPAAQRVGDAALALLSQPRLQGEVTVDEPGLLPMQTLPVDVPNWSVDDDFVVVSTQTSYVNIRRLRMGVTFADRFTGCHVRSPSAADLARDDTNTTGDDCASCVKQVALMPSGFEGGSVILARGQTGTHAYDGTRLAHYRCDLMLVRTADPVDTAIGRIYHEPFVETPLIGGDVGLFLDEGLGDYGEERWNNGIAALAVEVTDRRSFWVANGSAPFDDFNRTDAGPDIGDTSGTGLTWVRFQNTVSGSAPTTEVDGTRFHYLRTAAGLAISDTAFKLMEDDQFWRQAGPSYIFDVTLMIEVGNHPQGHNEFQLFVGDISGGANGGEYDDNGAYVRLRVGTSFANPGEADPWVLNVGNTIAADVDETLSFDPRTAGPCYLRFVHDGTDWKAKLWPVGDPEPDWGDPDTVTRPHDTDDDLITGNLFALYFSHKAFVAGENFEVWVDQITAAGAGAGYALERRKAVDGTLRQSVPLTLSASVAMRRSPNGQHVFLIYADPASEMEKYSRYPVLEETTVLGWGFDYTADPTFIDWNVDDEGFIYTLWNNGDGTYKVEKYSYPAMGTVWFKNLPTDYKAPTLIPVGGNGQQLYTGRSSGGNHYDAYFRVVGYYGGADWTDGSDAVVITMRRSDGEIENVQRLGGDEPTDAAQAIAIHRAGPCFHYVAVADGDTFEDLELPGLRAVIGRLPVGPT